MAGERGVWVGGLKLGGGLKGVRSENLKAEWVGKMENGILRRDFRPQNLTETSPLG